ncbi:chloride channel protein [Candidatus Sumerlaeota bacterium]|nr:chloride channel protein [Candidatus Sumerlaeota bacterium]
MPSRVVRIYWRLVARLRITEDQQSVFWAIVIGAGGGFAAFVFFELIAGISTLCFHLIPHWLGFGAPTDMGWQFVQMWIPALGGLIVGPMVYRWAIEARGHGVPEVMLAMSRESGRIRPRVGGVKSIASAVTLGSGGSAGQEGPIVQVGSALGSLIGQVLHMPTRKIKTFVACGAAAGISAVFNTPIAGVFFAIEVLLGELRPRSLIFIVLSSATAWVTVHLLMGRDRIFQLPPWQFLHVWEFFFWIVLGVLAALVGRLFVRSLYLIEDLFEKIPVRPWLRPALGGLGVGVIGIALPHVFGSGYRVMNATLNGTIFTRLGALTPGPIDADPSQLLLPIESLADSAVPLIDAAGGMGPILAAMGLMVILVFAKILATSMTLGSGGSGGVFAPALFIGAMLGGSFGLLLQLILPGHVAPPGAYAIIGMAATFAAAAHAPITAILIIYELTRSEAMIPAIMVATVVATLFGFRLAEDSIYTVKFKRRGLRIGDTQARDPLKQIQVREAMATEFFSIQPTMTIRQALLYAETVGQRAYPVVERAGGELLGLVTLYDLNLAMAANKPDTTPICEVMDPAPEVMAPEEYIDTAVSMLDHSDANMIPVVASREEHRLVGVLTHATLMRAYNEYQMERE